MTSPTCAPHQGLAPPLPSRGLRLTRLVLLVCAIGAVYAAGAAVGVVLDASPSARVAEAWRGYGYVVFAGLFVLLAWRPLAVRWLWELVIFHKVAMATTAALLAAGRAAAGTTAIVVADGLVSLLLVVGYVACRGWTAGSVRRVR